MQLIDISNLINKIASWITRESNRYPICIFSTEYQSLSVHWMSVGVIFKSCVTKYSRHLKGLVVYIGLKRISIYEWILEFNFTLQISHKHVNSLETLLLTLYSAPNKKNIPMIDWQIVAQFQQIMFACNHLIHNCVSNCHNCFRSALVLSSKLLIELFIFTWAATTQFRFLLIRVFKWFFRLY